MIGKTLVLDICLIAHRPVFRPLLLMYLAQKAGADVICRSYLGRSTTRKLVRQLNISHIIDDYLWNDQAAPETAFEPTSPHDEIFDLVPDLFARTVDPASILEQDLYPLPQECAL